MGSGRKGRGEGLGGKEGRRTAVRMLKTLIKNIKWMVNLKFVKIWAQRLFFLHNIHLAEEVWPEGRPAAVRFSSLFIRQISEYARNRL